MYLGMLTNKLGQSLSLASETPAPINDKFLLEFPTLKAGEPLKGRQCTLEGQARYVNVQDYRAVCTLLTIFMINLNKVSVLITISFYLSFRR